MSTECRSDTAMGSSSWIGRRRWARRGLAAVTVLLVGCTPAMSDDLTQADRGIEGMATPMSLDEDGASGSGSQATSRDGGAATDDGASAGDSAPLADRPDAGSGTEDVVAGRPDEPTPDDAAIVGGDPPPVASGFPDASTTGVPKGTSLKAVGSLTISKPGTVVDGVHVRGTINVRASDVTIRNTKVTAKQGAPYAISVGYDFRDIVIEDVELDGADSAKTKGVCCSGYTLRRADVSGFGTGAIMNRDVVIEDSYFHDTAQTMPEVHKASVASNGGSRHVVRDNTLSINASGASAALALYGDFAPIKDVTVERNLLNGGSYCTYGGSVGGKKFETANNVRYVANVFGNAFHSRCGIHGAVDSFDPSDPGNAWRNNIWQATGNPVTP